MYDTISSAKDYKIIELREGVIEYKNRIPRDGSSWKSLLILVPLMILYLVFILFVVEYEEELLKFLLQFFLVSFMPFFIFLVVLFRLRFRVRISTNKLSFRHSKFLRFYTKTYNKCQVKSVKLLVNSKKNQEGKNMKYIKIVMELNGAKHENLMDFKVLQDDFDRKYFEKIRNDFIEIINCE